MPRAPLAWLAALLVAATASGCLYDPLCHPERAASDCRYHFEGAMAHAQFAAPWNATRVAEAMRAAGFGEPEVTDHGARVAAGEAYQVFDGGEFWEFTETFAEPKGPAVLPAQVDAELANATARHQGAWDEALRTFEAKLGARHEGDTTWTPLTALE